MCILVPFFLLKIFYNINYNDVIIIYAVGGLIGLLLPEIDKIK